MSEYIFDYNQYKKTITNKSHFSYSLIIFIIILLLGLCVYFKPNKLKESKLHFVEIGSVQTYSSALNLSQEINSLGGAGFIFFDGTYHVLANYYSSYNDAEKVVENLKNDHSNAKVFSISSASFSKSKKLSSSQNSTVENFNNESKKIMIQFENIVTDLSINKIRNEEFSILMKNLRQDYDNLNSNIQSSFKNNSQFNKAKDYANIMATSLLNASTSETFALNTLRYELVSFVVNRHHFLSCF